MTDHPARRLWVNLETLHGVTYFAPESREAGLSLGLRGFWMTYFAFRAAPLGLVGAPVTVATFAGFQPAMIAKALPAAWDRTSPEACVAARAEVAAGVLRRAGVDPAASAEVVERLRPVIEAADFTGRPLFTANAALALGDDPVAALWQVATTLREHRGDGHIAALISAGISGLEAHLLQAAAGRFGGEQIRGVRGWSDEEWTTARERLARRGYLFTGPTDPEPGLTEAGRILMNEIETRTDVAAWLGGLSILGEAGVTEIESLLKGSVEAVRSAGVLPAFNPTGLPPDPHKP
jgi:hypothetical protein